MEFVRPCPKCNGEIHYNLLKNLQYAQKKNSTCLRCRPTKRKLTSEERSLRKVYEREYQQKYRRIKRNEIRITKKQYRLKIKTECIERYGNKCSCCGEKEFKFLTLEHKQGRWKDGIKDTRRGDKAYSKAKAEGYPDCYTILCFNCNNARGIYGKCPHENN